MAVAPLLLAGSAIAGGVGTAAGAGLLTLGAGMTAGGLATTSAVLGGLGQIAGGFEEASAIKAQARQEQMAAEFRSIELETQAAREKTQAAIESAQRQRELSRVLAEQRARFGGAGVDPFSGSPLRIQEATESEVLRQERQAGLFSSLSISALNRQAQQERISGQAAISIGKSKARSAITGGLVGASQTFGRLAESEAKKSDTKKKGE